MVKKVKFVELVLQHEGFDLHFKSIEVMLHNIRFELLGFKQLISLEVLVMSQMTFLYRINVQ